MKKVSVIVPVYNVEHYLVECLESVLKQGLTDLEVICVDDGSTDGSPRVLAHYASRDSRMIILTQENRGVSGARNTGMAHVSGEYVYFLDGDDFLAPNALEVMCATATKDRLDLLHFDTQAHFADGTMESEYGSYATYYERRGQYPEVQSGVALLAAMIENGDHKPAVYLRLVRAELCREVELSFHEGVIHEDNAYAFLCDMSAHRAGYISQKLHRRRVRPGSIITTRSDSDALRGYLTAYLDMLRCVEGRGGGDEFVTHALAQQIVNVHAAVVRAYCETRVSDRAIMTSADTQVDTVVAWKLLERHATAAWRAEQAEARLATCEDALRAIKGSRYYRLVKAVRAVLGRSK